MKHCCISQKNDAIFLAVDTLANEMFDSIDGIDSLSCRMTSMYRDTKTEPPASDDMLRFARKTTGANASFGQAVETHECYKVRRVLIVEAVKHAFRSGKSEESAWDEPVEVEARRVGAGWYPTLPAGVEHLKSAGREYSEEETSASIRSVMLEQKREISRRKLPDLAPANPSEVFPVKVENTEAAAAGVLIRVRSAVQQVSFLAFQPLIMTALSLLLFANL